VLVSSFQAAQRRAIAALRLQDQRKSDFLAVFAHELRNFLSPVSAAMTAIGLRGANDMGRAEPPRMMKCRLAPDRSLTPTLSQRARERWCCANFIVMIRS
jgi:signal transduction histidine kinase